MSYESPIMIAAERMRIEQERQLENHIYKAVQDYNIRVNKDELIKALEYDRGQYEQGYKDGLREANERIERDGKLCVPKGVVKARFGNYIVYDIDYLLENLSREITLLTQARDSETPTFTGTIKMPPEDMERLMKIVEVDNE